MAFHSSGNVGTKAGMKDQTSSNIARDGAAKRPQTKFPIKSGMRSRIGSEFSAEPGAKGDGPDASSPNVLAPSARGKTVKPAPIAWGMKDQTDSTIGRRVLDEGSVG